MSGGTISACQVCSQKCSASFLELRDEKTGGPGLMSGRWVLQNDDALGACWVGLECTIFFLISEVKAEV